jgi:phosphoesterase RecJ-like protein
VIEVPRLAEAVAVVAAAPRLAMACHVGPDGDALGSMLAVAAAARRRGKEVVASFGEPFTVPEAYRFLPVDLLSPPSRVPERPEVMLTFDAGSVERLGVLAAKAQAAPSLVVLDHHASNTGFGTLNLIVPAAASTAEVALALLDGLGWEIDQTVALCLLTGVVTDTGRFQYSNTTPDTLETAARLVGAGARPEVIGRHVYEEVPFGYLSTAAAVLGRAVLEPDRRLVWTVLHREDLAAGGIGLDDTDPLIDALRVARESDVAVLIKELDHGRVKVSLRSRGRVDVAAVAAALGGGGHHNASGFTFTGDAEQAIARVRELLPVG